MFKKLLLLLLVCMLTAGSDAWAARRVLLRDIVDEALPQVDGRTATIAEVEGALHDALKEHQWTIREEKPGHIYAVLAVRSKHFVSVNIEYDQSRLSVFYSSSVNLNYRETKKGRQIHPNYHEWIRWLVNSTRARLTSAANFRSP